MDRGFNWEDRRKWRVVFQASMFLFVWRLRGAQLFWDSIDEQLFDNRGRCAALAVLNVFRRFDPNVVVNEGTCGGTLHGNPHSIIHGRCTETVFNYLQLRYRVLCGDANATLHWRKCHHKRGFQLHFQLIHHLQVKGISLECVMLLYLLFRLDIGRPAAVYQTFKASIEAALRNGAPFGRPLQIRRIDQQMINVFKYLLNQANDMAVERPIRPPLHVCQVVTFEQRELLYLKNHV